MRFKLDSIWQRQGVIFLKSIGFLFVTLTVAAFLLFYGVQFVFGRAIFGDSAYSSPIQVSFISWGYHLWEVKESPVIYLSTISFISSLVGAVWLAVIIPNYKRHSLLQLLAVPWVAVILTSPIWGLVWSVNRWPPQGFSHPETMWFFYRTDILNGLSLGWLSALQSFPLNIFSYVLFCALLFVCKRFFLYNRENGA